MASIVRRRHAKVWTAFYRDCDGRLHCRSTATRDRKAAQKIAEEYEAAARMRRTVRQTARVLAEMHALAGGERLNQSSLRNFAAGWLESRRPEISVATYRSRLAHTSGWLARGGMAGSLCTTRFWLVILQARYERKYFIGG